MKAREESPTRRLVRSHSGDYVAELQPFYLVLRPYRSRSHRATVTAAWGRLYQSLIELKVEEQRRETAKARRKR